MSYIIFFKDSTFPNNTANKSRASHGSSMPFLSFVTHNDIINREDTLLLEAIATVKVPYLGDDTVQASQDDVQREIFNNHGILTLS